jgi:hypothetical protein
MKKKKERKDQEARNLIKHHSLMEQWDEMKLS